MTDRTKIVNELRDALLETESGEDALLETLSHSSDLNRRAGTREVGIISGWWERKHENAARKLADAAAERVGAQRHLVQKLTGLVDDTRALAKTSIGFQAERMAARGLLAEELASLKHASTLADLRRLAETEALVTKLIEARQTTEARIAFGPENLRLGFARKAAAIADAESAAGETPALPNGAAAPADPLPLLRQRLALARAGDDSREAERLEAAISALAPHKNGSAA
jgi:uncharacterized protein YcaQ